MNGQYQFEYQFVIFIQVTIAHLVQPQRLRSSVQKALTVRVVMTTPTRALLEPGLTLLD